MEKAEQAELKALRDKIKSEIGVINWRMQLDRDRLDALHTTLKGLDALLGVSEPQPKGADAVEAVAIEAIMEGNAHDYDGALTVAEIVRELAQRGWLPTSTNPESAVRASIRRLRERDPRWGLYRGRLYYHDRAIPSAITDEEEAAEEEGA